MADIAKMIEEIKEMKVTELAELVKAIEDTFGVTAAAPVAVAAAPAEGGAAAAQEQTEFTVVLKDFGAAKVGVIKVVKEITGLGLAEAKALVDGVVNEPKAVKEKVSKAEADEIAKKLTDAGATVELK